MIELREVLGEVNRPRESMARAIGPARLEMLAKAMGPARPARAVPANPPPHRDLPRVAPARPQGTARGRTL